MKYRALYFIHPDFDTTKQVNGLQVSNRGAIKMVEEDNSVRQAILLLLSTAKGERVMRPEYGCDLERLVFMPNDQTTLGLAIHLVRKALEQWEPRIEITQLDAEYNRGEQGRMDIVLEYRVRSTSLVDSLILPINLS